jgi:predicted nucleic acid-binding Zn ribbon protein
MMMTRFSDMLSSCLQKDTWQGYLLQHWHEIVGDLSARICLESIKGDTLFIGVHDVHWMHELFCLGQEIMAHINGQLTDAPIKQVRFVLSSRHRPKKKSPLPQKVLAAAVPRTEKLLNERQHHALAQIADPQLQEIIRQLMVRGK